LVPFAIWALEIFFQWQQALLWITGKFWRLSLIVNMLRLLPIGPIPTNTMRVAEAAIPEGNTYLKLRNALGTVFDDALFSPLFPSRGQPAAAPWRLALVTIMQFAEGLSDRDAADAVRTRIDWKYLLGLELSDPGFNYSILSRFRARLVENNAEMSLLQGLLERCHDLGLVRERSDMRTDSTHITHDLLAWYEVTPYKKPSDYVWATDANRAGSKRGKQPVSLSTVMRNYIQPATRKLGIKKKMSWHTFRHTFSTLLKSNGEDVKVVQELLRHSTAKMTLDTYTQALSPQKRAAQSKVVGMIRPKPSCTVVVPRVSGEIPVTH
jgi:transposase